jgi:hypothetical protein
VLDGHLVVVEFPRTLLRLYNASAAVVWMTLLEQGASTVEKILDSVASFYQVKSEHILADVQNLLEEWCQHGWLSRSQQSYCFNHELPSQKIIQNTSAPSEEVPTQDFITRSWIIELSVAIKIELCVELCAEACVDNGQESKAVFDRLCVLLSGLPNTASSPTANLRGRIHQQGFTLFHNDQCVGYYENHALGIAQLLYQIIFLSHPQEKFLLSLHAAGLSDANRKGIIFPGISGAGKSTLSILLTDAGWKYMGDDVIGMSVSGKILALPTAASLKFLGLEEFHRYQEQFSMLPTIRYNDKTAKYLPVANEKISSDPVPLLAWVFPWYASGEQLSVETLSPASILQKLIESGVGFAENLSHEEIEHFLKYLEQVPGYCIAYSDVNQVNQWLKTL